MAAKIPKQCILVAEDDALTGELLRALLEKPGREILLATDGEMALQMARKYRPQLVLLDLVMPVRGGLEVLRMLRKERPPSTARIIVLSAQEQRGIEEEARRNGADDYMAKPFDPDELDRRIGQLLPEEVLAK